MSTPPSYATILINPSIKDEPSPTPPPSPTSLSPIPTKETNFLQKFYQKLCRIKWSNVIYLSVLHILGVIGYIHICQHPVKIQTIFFTYFIGLLSGLSVTIGAHRLLAHRTYKATLLLKLILAIGQSMTMLGSAYAFARDHRTHHKYSDTEGDPKNPSRGLFYSHIGWWLLKKSQVVKDHGAKLDFSDLRQERIFYFQHRFYSPLFVLFGLVLPTIIPYYGWNESPWVSFYVCAILRILYVIHHYSTVNSIAHFFGHRPYDFRIRPTENRLVIYLSFGEGNHNYHHVFPYDYSSSEKKAWEFFNPSTLIIDLFVWLGLAYDCKKASPTVIEGTIKRKGMPAKFDPPRSLGYRICNGIVDWIIGILVCLYPTYPAGLYKYFSGQTLIHY